MRSLFILSLFVYHTTPIKTIRFTGYAQGTTYQVTYYAADTTVNQQQIDSILQRIDLSLSLYKPNSLISQFNRSREGIAVDQHFHTVVNKALDTYKRTNGLFDITIFPITSAWGFGPVSTDSIPDSSSIRSILPCVSSKLISWRGSKLIKSKPCVRLDANGIAQGYTVDVIARFLESRMIKSYLVEIGGEIRINGRKLPSGKKMSVGIETPGDDPEFTPLNKIIWMDHGAITTSGNYRRYHESKGEKFTHLMDPHTGYPLHNELISVTVFARDAITADAYDNALMAMGLKKAIAFIEKRKDMSAHFIYRKSDGTVGDTMSSRFHVLLRP